MSPPDLLSPIPPSPADCHVSLIEMPDKRGSKISAASQLEAYRWANLEGRLKFQIVVFFLLHYFLLISSICLILWKRFRQHTDFSHVMYVSSPDVRQLIYLSTGINYAKYNIEIMNYIYFGFFVKDLKYHFNKIMIELFLMFLVGFKIYLYISEMAQNYMYVPVGMWQIAGEFAILSMHFLILVLYLVLHKRMERDKFSKIIYGKDVLGKKMLVA